MSAALGHVAPPPRGTGSQHAVAFGLFAEVEGAMVLQHPVRFTAEQAEQDKRMYDKSLRMEVRPLFDLTVTPAPSHSAGPAAGGHGEETA